MEAADLAFWMAATPAERIRGVTMLIDEMCAMAGEDGPTPRTSKNCWRSSRDAELRRCSSMPTSWNASARLVRADTLRAMATG
jgi:hypothetical protein